MRHASICSAAMLMGLIAFGCSDDDDDGDDNGNDDNPMDPDSGVMGVDPDVAPAAQVDRFSEAAGTLMVRDGENGLPAAGQPIDFDGGPFITQGLGPAGEIVRYYNFDVQPTAPAPIYAFVRASSGAPVADQLNVVGVIPGDAGYNDFWRVVEVRVPDNYVPNSITSAGEIMSSGYATMETDTLVNCPIVPNGSTADERLGGGDAGLVRGWYNGMVVFYFHFGEKPNLAPVDDAVPLSSILVTFNINPNEKGGGPPSGFYTEEGSAQTHNVVTTLPSDTAYSPLWEVSVYDNADFGQVSDLPSANAAAILARAVANVNCPIVAVE